MSILKYVVSVAYTWECKERERSYFLLPIYLPRGSNKYNKCVFSLSNKYNIHKSIPLVTNWKR